ncbi:hypothetical protein HRG_003239 [Hirsutella rhossiliensis]|uniref:DUF1754-domain-containing protein n=1 Tax=Hirsutella rhossiliensis TaxID=111463 RepID=A0A9P8SJE6_9HYPO|nr:uncharacterized protein HRG_03239 [Hirsutella rhossiliensis]KAH0965223.1 hypothetical protein HRG_03239 [Hirsutella rhossiliensis]
MPSDDYAAIGGGALRLKGAKVQKKKKKKRDKTDLEKNLAAGDDDTVVRRNADDDDNDDGPKDVVAQQGEVEDDETPVVPKTESERRYAEVKKKRLLQMTQASGTRSELLKTHKERVEELNTYLSKLSEHHDMPKIGPG